jgi:hypothetical protein
VSETPGSGPQPVLPRTIEVGDLVRTCVALGFPEPNPGAQLHEIELLPGRSLTLRHGLTTETRFVYVCVDDLSQARRSIEASFGSATWNPDTIGSESGRFVGRLLQANRLVIDGARCRIAMRTGQVPCDTDCSPMRRFN